MKVARGKLSVTPLLFLLLIGSTLASQGAVVPQNLADELLRAPVDSEEVVAR